MSAEKSSIRESEKRRRKVGYLKIVIGGPYASGKTTFVKTVCENPLLTDVQVTSRYEKRIKPTTTVAFDYGKVIIDGIPVYLFGTPGQVRFRFMWNVLVTGMHGYIFVVDSSSRMHVLRGRAVYYMFFKKLGEYPHLIAANKQDLPSALPLSEVAKIMGVDIDLVRPLIALDKESALRVIRELVSIILAKEEK